MRTRRPKFVAKLPATPVTEEMRKQIVKLASGRGESVATIQREAFSLFLSSHVRDANMRDNNIESVDVSAEAVAS